MIYGVPLETLLAEGAEGAPHYSCPNGANGDGDVVVIFLSAGGSGAKDCLQPSTSTWASAQYATRAAGLRGTPDGIPMYDGSADGCVSPRVPLRIGDAVGAEQAGVGHCNRQPAVGSTVTIPIVGAVDQNAGACPQGDGYCATVEALVLVTILYVDRPHVVEGVIVGVLPASNCPGFSSCDPQHVVQFAGDSPPSTLAVDPSNADFPQRYARAQSAAPDAALTGASVASPGSGDSLEQPGALPVAPSNDDRLAQDPPGLASSGAG
jgi:hypothetical protein